MPHIYEYVLVNANGEHMKQFNTVIKTLFYGISGNEMNDTFDTFWSEYTSFNYKNGPFYCDYFIQSKSHKDKSRFLVIGIPYQKQDMEHNTMQENQRVDQNKTPDKQSVDRPNPEKQSVEQLLLFHGRLCFRRNRSTKI